MENNTQNSPAEPVKTEGIQQNGQTPKRKKLFILAAAILLAAAGFYLSPWQVWGRFVSGFGKEDYFTEKFTVAYKDNGQAVAVSDANQFLSLLKGANFEIAGNVYADLKDKVSPKADANLSLSLGNISSSMTLRSGAKIDGENIYMQVGSDTVLKNIFYPYVQPDGSGWVKLNLKEFSEYAAETDPDSPKMDFNTLLGNEAYANIAKKYSGKIVKNQKFLGFEKLPQGRVAHFRNSLEKTALNQMLNEYLEAMLLETSGQASGSKEVEEAKNITSKILNSLIERLEVQKFETWVGLFDGRLYKLEFESSAPSLISFVSEGLAVPYDPESTQTPEEQALNALSKVSYDGHLRISEEFSDYGKSRQIDFPTDSVNLLKAIQQQEQSENIIPYE